MALLYAVVVTGFFVALRESLTWSYLTAESFIGRWMRWTQRIPVSALAEET
jgi:hypothetical protein